MQTELKTLETVRKGLEKLLASVARDIRAIQAADARRGNLGLELEPEVEK